MSCVGWLIFVELEFLVNCFQNFTLYSPYLPLIFISFHYAMPKRRVNAAYERKVSEVLKEYRLQIICVFLIILVFLLIDSNKPKTVSSSDYETSNEQLIEVDLENVIEEVEKKTANETEKEPEQDDKTANKNEEEPKRDNKTERTVYLTFDDGPSSASHEILDTLQQFNAKATFFMLEPAMRAYPDMVKRMIKEGHAVGLHGVTHDRDKFYQSEQAALNEMRTGQATLESISGVRTHLIRSPFGSVPYLTDSFRTVLENDGFKLWDWNVDSSDWNLSADEYVQHVISQVEELVQAGGTPIILMHDRGETASHLSILLSYLQEHGYQTSVIDESAEPYNFNCYNRCYRIGK